MLMNSTLKIALWIFAQSLFSLLVIAQKQQIRKEDKASGGKHTNCIGSGHGQLVNEDRVGNKCKNRMR